MRKVPPAGSPLRKPVIYSCIIHLAIIIMCAVIPGLTLPFNEKPLKVDVMWAELPKGTSEEIGLGVKKAENLPQSTVEEQKRLFQPEVPKNPKSAEAELKTPPLTEEKQKPSKTKNEPRPEIDVSKMKRVDANAKPKPLSKSDRQIKDALAKIGKELSGRQVVPESAQVKESGEGYKYGTSNKPLRTLPTDPEYLKYQAMIRAKIMREWILPGKYTDEGGNNYNSQMEVMINIDGEVTSIRWISASNNVSYDQSAIRAVKKASPFPKPPDKLAWEAYNEGFLIEFDPRLKLQ